MPRRIDIPCDELRQLYEDARWGTVALSQHYGCSPTTIAQRLRMCGVHVRDTRFRALEIPAEELRRLYADRQIPVGAIARHFGVSMSTLGNWRRALGIPARRPRHI